MNNFSKAKVLCIGDLILDCYAVGGVEKISPEAPIPILKLNKKEYILGGAGNVARNISAGGGYCFLLSVIGKDNAEKKLIKLLGIEKNIEPLIVKDPKRPTTIKTRFVSGSQQILRVDDEINKDINQEMEIKVFRLFKKKIRECDIVIISDYSKGLLTDNLLKLVIKESKKNQKPVIVDPKKTNFSIYKGADIITPNYKELLNATNHIYCKENNEEKRISFLSENLIKQNSFNTIITTRSSKGMLVFSRKKKFQLSSEALEVYDVSGAGDTVVAYLSLGISAGLNIKEATHLANKAAGIVVGKFGTAIVKYSELGIKDELKKKVSLAQAIQLLKKTRIDKKVGFTNGCFDLFHAGHLKFLSEAKKRCDFLVVGLNSDSSIKTLKGKYRPINNQKERTQILSYLPFIDLVILFNEKTPIKLIKGLKPNFLFKGADYNLNDIVGSKEMNSWGGEVILIQYIEGHSTTNLINRIKHGT